MVDLDAAVEEHQFEIAVADGKHQIPTNRPQDHLGGELPPLEAVAPIHWPRRALSNRGPYTGNPPPAKFATEPPGVIGSRRASAGSNCCVRRVWPSRSATPPGRRKSGCVGAIASSPGLENRPQWSPPRSLENWRALPGRSPNTFKPLTLDALRSIADITKRRSSPATLLSKTEQGWRHGHGQENPRVHYQPDIFRRWRLDRGSSATHHRSGGIQPAHQSMINRRFDDRASCPAQSRPF